MKKERVQVQKGPINPNPMTSKQMTHEQKVQERASELRDLKKGQTLDFYTPKK